MSSFATPGTSRAPNGTASKTGQLGDDINPWGAAMFRTLRTVEPHTSSEDAAYGKWLDQTSDRQQARQDRVHGAAGVIPTPLWIVLFAIALVIFVYMLFFADSGEGAVTQSILMGAVVFVIVTMLLLLQFLDNPYRPGVGALRPAAMERALRIMDQELEVVGIRRATPLRCFGPGDRGRGTVSEAGPSSEKRDTIELFATLLLAVAAVATAWSSYQANRWNGEQVKAGSRTNALRIDAARAQGLAEAETQVDVATFIQWVNAYATDDTRAAGLLCRAIPRRVPARVRRVDRNESAAKLRRTVDAVQDGRIRAGVEGGGHPSRRRGGGVVGTRAAQPATLGQLRARSRAVRRHTVLRRHQHEAE